MQYVILMNKLYHLIVQPSEPSISLLGPPVESDNVASIARCTSVGFWPSDINMTWTMQDGPAEPAINQKVTDTGNFTFMVTSDYRRAVNRTLNGKTITCTVSHVSLPSPRSGSKPLTVLCEYNITYKVHYLCYFHYMFMNLFLKYRIIIWNSVDNQLLVAHILDSSEMILSNLLLIMI